MDELNTEAQEYFDLGYLATTNGRFVEYEDFKEEWAQLGWYQWWTLDEKARNFYVSAHFKWSSAYRSADISGCGFAFAIQDNEEHYAVFLDRSKVYFVETGYYYEPIGPTRGTGRVNFGNPFDSPVEADFTLIVKGAYAYVLVDGEVVGEYTLSESRAVRGNLGLTLLSGTNKDFGTRCEMTNLHIWIPRGE
jgi:alpha-amylase/alpha-mannosidase (GH57 family)